MKARVSSAVIMMAITVLCMALGRVTRVLYFAACACICAYELYKNLKDKDVTSRGKHWTDLAELQNELYPE